MTNLKILNNSKIKYLQIYLIVIIKINTYYRNYLALIKIKDEFLKMINIIILIFNN